MTEPAPLRILPIHPLSAAPVPTSPTLSAIRRMCAHETGPSLRWHPSANDPENGRRLLDRLEGLAIEHDTLAFVCQGDLGLKSLNRLVVQMGQRRCNLRLCVECSVDEGSEAPDPAGLPGITLQIRWRPTGRLPAPGFFRAYGNLGIWNHLVLAGSSATASNTRMAAAQPTILHSWEVPGEAFRDGPPEASYGAVRPLPGRPLWHVLSDPADRLLLMARWTRDRLVRLRVDSDGDRLYTVGEHLRYHFVPPHRLPEGYLDEICAMVAAGGTVATTHVRANLERAFLIGYVLERGAIVGNSSLKNPRSAYIEAVRNQSGLDLGGFVERGYTSVRPEYRGLGIGTRLLAGLTERAGDRKIFSVIAEDNEATKTIARRNRTRRVATYFSEKAGKPVGIWMPAWMIDDEGKEQR